MFIMKTNVYSQPASILLLGLATVKLVSACPDH